MRIDLWQIAEIESVEAHDVANIVLSSEPCIDPTTIPKMRVQDLRTLRSKHLLEQGEMHVVIGPQAEFSKGSLRNVERLRRSIGRPKAFGGKAFEVLRPPANNVRFDFRRK
jgi:hypothetical protein